MMTIKWHLFFLILTIHCDFIFNYELSLNGEWLVKIADGDYVDLPATVPGGIYTDLMRNGVINDTMWGYNDRDTRWVSKTDWIYYRNFTVNETSRKNVNLVFEGLDTFAKISLNGKEIGQTENMFVRYIFNISDAIQIGGNYIEIYFFSPITKANEAALNLPHEIFPLCVPEWFRGECHVNLIRKMQASYAWDWGPAFPSMGIWKNVYLESFDSAKIRYVVISTEEGELSWTLNISTYYDGGNLKEITGKAVFKLNTDTAVIEQDTDLDLKPTDSQEFIHNHLLTVSKAYVRKWWPNGYGEAKLYNLTVTYVNEEEISEQTISIGFRKIEIVEDDLVQGATFYFKVNNLPIYIKGSNEIPLDILPEKGQDPKLIDKIFDAVKKANMNMLRVWGGGVYESDYFYKKADELGIMIWQDFMFACALYPATSEYLDNVIDEIQHQSKRLQSHPSIVIWAGNNENEESLVYNFFGNVNRTVYDPEYYDLYINTIMKEFKNISPSSLFVSSSPSNGKQSVAENYISDDPNGQIYGDLHYYSYDKDTLTTAIYPLPRFTSEYGFQSYPAIESWQTVTDDRSDLSASSYFVEHRQHLLNGLNYSDKLIGFQFDVPEDFETYIYYTQIIQAWSTKFETEYYRSYKGRLSLESKGYHMGSLYWQLNDVWVAPSWSGIDYTGRWKMLQYFAINFFAPTIITGYSNFEGELKIYAITDEVSYPTEVTAVVQVYNWTSFSPLDILYINTTIEYDKSVEVTTIDTNQYLQSIGCGTVEDATLNCFFHLSLTSHNTLISPENFVTVGKLKNSKLEKANIQIKSVRPVDIQNKRFEIQIISDKIALFVWLDTHIIQGQFSENGFLLVEPEKKIYFESNNVVSLDQLKKALTIKHLLSHT